MAEAKLLLTEFANHHRFASCVAFIEIWPDHVRKNNLFCAKFDRQSDGVVASSASSSFEFVTFFPLTFTEFNGQESGLSAAAVTYDQINYNGKTAKWI